MLKVKSDSSEILVWATSVWALWSCTEGILLLTQGSNFDPNDILQQHFLYGLICTDWSSTAPERLLDAPLLMRSSHYIFSVGNFSFTHCSANPIFSQTSPAPDFIFKNIRFNLRFCPGRYIFHYSEEMGDIRKIAKIPVKAWATAA